MSSGRSNKNRRTETGRVPGGETPSTVPQSDPSLPGGLQKYSEFCVYVNIDNIQKYQHALRPVDVQHTRVQEMKTIFGGVGYGTTKQYIAVTYLNLPKTSVIALKDAMMKRPANDVRGLTDLTDLDQSVRDDIAQSKLVLIDGAHRLEALKDVASAGSNERCTSDGDVLLPFG